KPEGGLPASGVHGAVPLRAQHPRQGGQAADELPGLEGIVDADVQAVLPLDATGDLLGLLAVLRLYLEGTERERRAGLDRPVVVPVPPHPVRVLAPGVVDLLLVPHVGAPSLGWVAQT